MTFIQFIEIPLTLEVHLKENKQTFCVLNMQIQLTLFAMEKTGKVEGKGKKKELKNDFHLSELV